MLKSRKIQITLEEPPEVLTFEEAAEFLRVSQSTLRRLVTEKAVPFSKVGRQLRFSRKALEEMLDPSAEEHFRERWRQEIREKTGAAMLRHQAEGRRMSHRLPYGWKLDPVNPKRMIEDQDEQDNIDTILALRSQGLSSRKIAREMERRGLPFRRRASWYGRTVLRILQREGMK